MFHKNKKFLLHGHLKVECLWIIQRLYGKEEAIKWLSLGGRTSDSGVFTNTFITLCIFACFLWLMFFTPSTEFNGDLSVLLMSYDAHFLYLLRCFLTSPSVMVNIFWILRFKYLLQCFLIVELWNIHRSSLIGPPSAFMMNIYIVRYFAEDVLFCFFFFPNSFVLGSTARF